MNLGPLKEQMVLLMAVPSCQLQVIFLKKLKLSGGQYRELTKNKYLVLEGQVWLKTRRLEKKNTRMCPGHLCFIIWRLYSFQKPLGSLGCLGFGYSVLFYFILEFECPVYLYYIRHIAGKFFLQQAIFVMCRFFFIVSRISWWWKSKVPFHIF